jgi:hypothetical protein
MYQCDDGNNEDGDGCDYACRIEPGYDCVVKDDKVVCTTLSKPIIYIEKNRVDPQKLTLHFSEAMNFDEDGVDYGK